MPVITGQQKPQAVAGQMDGNVMSFSFLCLEIKHTTIRIYTGIAQTIKRADIFNVLFGKRMKISFI